MLSYTNQIIELAKKTKNLNISPFAFAFRWCNNDCPFCYLRDYMLKKPLSLDTIKDIDNSVITWLTDNIDKIPNDISFELTFIGGEMFCLDESYYDEYRHLIDEVTNIVKGHNIKYTFFSNLLYSNINNLIKLAKDYNGIITTSFDTIGRYKSEEVLNQWYSNIKQIRDNNIELTIGMILSKESIYNIMHNNNIYTQTYYKLLDEGWNLDYDVFIPNSESNYNNIPTQEELIEFHKYIIDRYWGHLPNNPIFNYEEANDILEYPIYVDCAKVMFLPSNEINPKMNAVRGEYNIAELYCNDMCRFNTLQNVKQSIVKNENSKEFICISNKKQVEYYYDNILKCSICKVRGYCNRENLRDCYVVKRYSIWDDKCWIKQVLQYIKKKYEQDI